MHLEEVELAQKNEIDPVSEEEANPVNVPFADRLNN